MAVAEQQDLIPDLDNIPAPIKRAATMYKKASTEKSRALESFNGKRDNLIALMVENECPAIPIELDGVKKIIRLEDLRKLKIEPAKKPPAAGEE